MTVSRPVNATVLLPVCLRESPSAETFRVTRPAPGPPSRGVSGRPLSGGDPQVHPVCRSVGRSRAPFTRYVGHGTLGTFDAGDRVVGRRLSGAGL